MALRIVRASRGADEKGGKAPKTPKASAFFKELPALWEFLAVSKWDDGEERTTGTALFFVEDGVVKLCLNDRDSDRVAFVTGSSAEEVLEAASAGLEGDALDWRASRRAKSNRKG